MSTVLVVAVTLPAALGAQRAPVRTLRGTVIDTTGGPIAYSNVLVNNKARIVADDSGRFSLKADSGKVLNLRVRRIGFRERILAITMTQDTALRVALDRSAQALPVQRVTAEGRAGSLDINGFYRRLAERETGIHAGYFITPEEIEQRRPYRATQLLERVPGVRLAKGKYPMTEFGLLALGLDKCQMSIYLDRIRLNSMSGRGEPVYIDDIVSPTSVAGIEVYTSAVKAPPEFQSLNGTCGVILLWTK